MGLFTPLNRGYLLIDSLCKNSYRKISYKKVLIKKFLMKKCSYKKNLINKSVGYLICGTGQKVPIYRDAVRETKT